MRSANHPRGRRRACFRPNPSVRPGPSGRPLSCSRRSTARYRVATLAIARSPSITSALGVHSDRRRWRLVGPCGVGLARLPGTSLFGPVGTSSACAIPESIRCRRGRLTCADGPAASVRSEPISRHSALEARSTVIRHPAPGLRRYPTLPLGRALNGAVPRQPVEWILCGSIVRIRRVWLRPPYHGYGVPR